LLAGRRLRRRHMRRGADGGSPFIRKGSIWPPEHSTQIYFPPRNGTIMIFFVADCCRFFALIGNDESRGAAATRARSRTWRSRDLEFRGLLAHRGTVRCWSTYRSWSASSADRLVAFQALVGNYLKFGQRLWRRLLFMVRWKSSGGVGTLVRAASNLVTPRCDEIRTQGA